MKKLLIVAILFFGISDAFAQEETNTTTATPNNSNINSAAFHYSKIYQRALRYNDVNAAKNALYNLVSMFPQNDSLLYSLSLIYFQSQQYASAALSTRDVLSLNPDHAGALELGAISYEQLGALENAITAYEQLYLKTDDYQALYKMAFLQFEAERYNESLTNADILLNREETQELTITFSGADNQQKEYPITAALYNLKGLIAQEKNNIEEARKLFNQALEIAPEFTMAKQNLESLDK